MTLNPTNKRAFTLAELLAVIAIMATLTLVAVPTLKSIQATALQSAARQVSNTLQLTRQYAITQRASARFLIAVDTSSGEISEDLICKAYCVTEPVGDENGTLLYWRPVTDWKILPEGVVFSDLNITNYNTIDLDPVPDLGNSGTRTIDGSGTDESRRFENVENIWVTNNLSVGGGTIQWNVAAVEFRPTGLANISGTGGIRLMQGAVLNPSDRTLLISDTNNWVYIETDRYGGRVRTRYRDSYN